MKYKTSTRSGQCTYCRISQLQPFNSYVYKWISSVSKHMFSLGFACVERCVKISEEMRVDDDDDDDIR